MVLRLVFATTISEESKIRHLKNLKLS